MVSENILWRLWSYISSMRITDILDILIVAFLIYKLLAFVRKTNTKNLAIGAVMIVLALGLSELFNLTMINYILRKTIELGLLAVIILFQPELRRLLERIGSSFSSKNKAANTHTIENAIQQTIIACEDMSESKTGALILFEKDFKLNDFMDTGTKIDSEVTAELLKNIFFNKAPLHDGAVIIKDGRIASAGCVLPLTKNKNLSKDLGMRHRAGIGISEESDAIVLIVSEETGSISCALDGVLKRNLDAKTLDIILRSELIVDEQVENDNKFVAFLKRTFTDSGDKEGNKNEKNNKK